MHGMISQPLWYMLLRVNLFSFNLYRSRNNPDHSVLPGLPNMACQNYLYIRLDWFNELYSFPYWSIKQFNSTKQFYISLQFYFSQIRTILPLLLNNIFIISISFPPPTPPPQQTILSHSLTSTHRLMSYNALFIVLLHILHLSVPICLYTLCTN